VWRIGALERMALADQVEQAVHRDEIGCKVGAVEQMAHPHQLDVAQLDAPFETIIEQRHDLVMVASPHRHHVDPHRHARRARGLDASQHGRQVARSADGTKCQWIEGVKADVDPPDACRQQHGQPVGQQLAIGGQGKIGQTEPGNSLQDRFELWGDQRFTTGDAHRFDAGGELQQPHGADELGRFELIGAFDQPLAMRNAVDAGVVAGRRQAEPQFAKATP
jgi:hypothetical protein